MIKAKEGAPFCGIPEMALANANAMCKWPQQPVTVCHQLTVLDRTTCDRVMANVCDMWSAVSGINLVPTDDSSNANILITSSTQIDPSGRILGLTYLPCGLTSNSSQMSEMINPAQGWTEELLHRVMLHETGHGVGLGHVPIGTGAVMEPILTPLTIPQTSDIQEMVSRYGSITAPVPRPMPAPTSGGDVFGDGVLINIPAAGTYLFRVSMVKQ